jgi:predicted Na+-dependent transporter
VISAGFRDGLIVLSVIPGTINICVAQTLAAGGNMGTAIFNAIFGNVIGTQYQLLHPSIEIYLFILQVFSLLRY